AAGWPPTKLTSARRKHSFTLDHRRGRVSVKPTKLARWTKGEQLAQWAAAAAEILSIAGILAISFTAGNYIAAQERARQASLPTTDPANPVGIIEGHRDVGNVLRAGSVQYREEKGAATHEIQANVSAPKRLRLVKRGAYFSMWLADKGGEFHLAGGSTRIALQEPFYVGVGVCSHDANVIEKAVFSNVYLNTEAQHAADESTATTVYSALEIVTVASRDRRVVYIVPERFEAPNWMPDGKTLLFNRNGRIEKIPATGGTPQV